ncbi:MAG TPA: hypothetical protein PKK26_01315 [Candidatus Wallbacteria bacterium]|nr:hypothetical protein [Candidatus Wallbacteria bacterium]
MPKEMKKCACSCGSENSAEKCSDETPAAKSSPEEVKISELIHGGYEEENDKKAADLWLNAWNKIVKAHGGKKHDFYTLCETFHVKFSMDAYQWLEDMDEMFSEILCDDEKYFQKWMKFQAELLENFTDIDEDVLKDVKTSFALNHFKIGDAAGGDKIFAELINQFPEDDLLYLYWSEPYEEEAGGYEKIPADYNKALGILQKALDESDRDNLEEIEDAMKALKKKIKKN